MTDVVQTAMDYRQRLLADILRVDEFLRIGEYLLRISRSAAGATDRAGSPEAAASERPQSAAAPEAPPRRALAFRGACDDSEPALHRNIA